MTEPRFSPGKLTDELHAWLIAKGVTRFVFTIEDPDFPATGRGYHGGRMWAIGALETLKAELLEEVVHAERG